jgi:galactitol-specific phosphotransferase system IIB component
MSSEDEAQARQLSGLVDLAMRYFKKEGYRVEREATTLESLSGISSKFDLVVQKGRVAQGVWVRSWNRTIGINVIINLDKFSENVGLSNPILIGEKFSDHAKLYAYRRKVTLLTKQQMIRSLR